jgi:hypothetical protein
VTRNGICVVSHNLYYVKWRLWLGLRDLFPGGVNKPARDHRPLQPGSSGPWNRVPIANQIDPRHSVRPPRPALPWHGSACRVRSRRTGTARQHRGVAGSHEAPCVCLPGRRRRGSPCRRTAVEIGLTRSGSRAALHRGASCFVSSMPRSASAAAAIPVVEHTSRCNRRLSGGRLCNAEACLVPTMCWSLTPPKPRYRSGTGGPDAGEPQGDRIAGEFQAEAGRSVRIRKARTPSGDRPIFTRTSITPAIGDIPNPLSEADRNQVNSTLWPVMSTYGFAVA